MKKIVTAFIAAATMAVTLPVAANAAPWQPIGQRKANIERRIDVGIRNGALTRAEASNLRTRFANLQRLEWRYRHNGLKYRERVELDRRYNALSVAVAHQRHDRQTQRHHRR